jgi:hypothetical protein
MNKAIKATLIMATILIVIFGSLGVYLWVTQPRFIKSGPVHEGPIRCSYRDPITWDHLDCAYLWDKQ